MQPAVCDIVDNALGYPGQLAHPWVHLLVQGVDSVAEESTVSRLQTPDDMVVVPDKEHHVLSEHTQLLAGLVERGCKVGHIKSHSLPIPHLIQQLLQCLAEVAGQQARPVGRWSKKKQIGAIGGGGINK